MKKYIVLGLAALLIASTPILSERAFDKSPAEEQTSPSLDGTAKIAKIRTAYERGDYDDFLSEREKALQEAQDSGSFAGMVALRDAQEPLTEDKNFEKQRSEALFNLLSVKDSSAAAEKIRSAARILPPSQEEALSKMGTLRTLPLNQGKNQDENELIAIDAAYEYKLLTLPKTSDLREKQAVLFMDRMHQMQSSAKFFDDSSWKKTVEEASLALDATLARNWDLTDLYAIANGQKKASNLLEEEAQDVLAHFQK